MALIRPVPTDQGGSVEYWRIEEIKDDIPARRLEFVLRGYVNEAARRAGCQFVYEYPLVMAPDEYSSAPGLSRLYQAIKTMPQFAEAEDG
ncbi:MAG TPA: hypothetical protein VLW75_10430 [Rhizomicrobium sp.]|nr:hypothetical protein [Rhizomicrobium sp.]